MGNAILRNCLILFLCISMQMNAQVPVPYSSSFDTVADTVGWSHYAVYGTDDWQLGTPSKTYLNSARSNPNAWVTKLVGTPATFSSRCIQTPVFDLSDTTDKYYISFYHKWHYYIPSSFYVEYSLNGGSTWLMLSGTAIPQSNWQTVSAGFSSTSYMSFAYSSFSLKHLQGNPSVTIRFRMNTSSSSSGEGWMIDDFSISKENFNATANRGPDIVNLNKNFTQVTITSLLGFSNPYSFVNMKNSFYFSRDSVFDVGDTLLYSNTAGYFGNITNWANTVNLPSGLFARDYYVFYRLDELNAIDEIDETDNVSYVIIKLDSIFSSDYSDNFDHPDEYWNAFVTTPSSSIWNKGDPNLWQMENPHSGENCWYPLAASGAANYLESPYLDLSGTTNNTICFWYRDARIYSSSATLSYLELPSLSPSVLTSPSFTSSILLPTTRNTWDCYCRSLSAYDGNNSTKFRISGGADQNLNYLAGILVDDVYIGSAKPDLSIEGEKKDRFTTDARNTDTLFYLLYNSGLQSSPASQTDFYWSADSLLDAGDLLLGSKPEPALTDTSFSRQTFVYTKPTLVSGKYFILYVIDPALLINEMREFNDTGYFELHQYDFTSLPYSNDFETQIDNWTHYATLGTDDWEWGVPSKPGIPGAFSGSSAWITNDSSGVSVHSRMHLLSPVFDLSQLSGPVIEFNMKNISINPAISWYGGANMYYSVDGGYKWNVLRPVNRSFARWYDTYDFEYIGGTDKITFPLQTNMFEGKKEFLFADYFTYQTRDADDITSFCMDLGFLSGYTQVQLKLNFASEDGMVDGVMMDDFRITEGAPDLVITNTSNLFCDSTDKFFRVNLSIKNAGNKLINQIDYNVYLSADSVLDGSDLLFYSDTNADSLRPSFRREYNIKQTVPSNYGTYNYVIFELDPANALAELNELNNVKSWPLNLISNPPLSYFNDFNAAEIHGWTYYIDSSGYYFGHRFRHKRVQNDFVYGTLGGEWFLDRMVSTPSSIGGITRQYIESPSFDFSTSSSIKMEFDFMCIGEYAGFNTEGGNVQYSEDGGLTWITLTVVQDPYAVNWYNGSAMNTIFNQPGWGFMSPSYSHAIYDLSFLQGKSNIRIRFQYRGNRQITTPGVQGFRLDNFKITAGATDLVANDILVPVSADINQPYFTINYSVSNAGNLACLPTLTNFFWSEDNVFDTADIQLYSFPESIINGLSTNSHIRNIYYPVPVTQYVYYLFYKSDHAAVVNELDEMNNYGSYIVTFNSLTGIEESVTQGVVNVFVNAGLLSVSGHLSENEKEGVAEVYGLNGTLVKTHSFYVSGKDYKFQIPVSGLSSDLYILNLKFKTNPAEQIKFTITK